MISLNGFLRGLSYPCEVPGEVSFHGVFPKTVAKKGKHSTPYLNSSSKANMFAGNYMIGIFQTLKNFTINANRSPVAQ